MSNRMVHYLSLAGLACSAALAPSDLTRATVNVHRTSMTVIVTIQGRSTDLVLLFEKEPGAAIFVTPLQPGLGVSAVVFPAVPQGEYFIAVAPPELTTRTPAG
jgi:hypothetical protein